MTLLSHYWREDDPAELTEAIARDWADILEDVPQNAIHQACMRYLREHPSRKPTPGAIAAMARESANGRHTGGPAPVRGNRDTLSGQEVQILDMQVIPNARRWLAEFPNLAHHARQTLDYWGERHD